MEPITMNHTAIIAAAIAAYVFTFFWYGLVHGKLRIQLPSSNVQELKSHEWYTPMLILNFSFIPQLLLAYVAALILSISVPFFFLMWIGFIPTLFIHRFAYSRKNSNLALFIDAHGLASVIIMTIVLMLWP